MQTRITARHFTLREDLKEYIESRMDRLQRYYDGITDARVILTVDRGTPLQRHAEIVVSVFRQQLMAQDVAETHELAIDACVEGLRRQLLRYKSKLRRTDQKLHR
jgi:putative sigma-54 modulation protein